MLIDKEECKQVHLDTLSRLCRSPRCWASLVVLLFLVLFWFKGNSLLMMTPQSFLDPPGVVKSHVAPAVVLSDSMCRNMTSDHVMQVFSYSGRTIKDLHNIIQKNTSLVQGRHMIILHVGTNDIGGQNYFYLYKLFKNNKITESVLTTSQKTLNYLYPDQTTRTLASIKTSYSQLIHTVQEINPSAVLMISSVLPRVFDHAFSAQIVAQINQELDQLATQSPHTIFLPSIRLFLNDATPIEALFIDGLHLNEVGTTRLRDYFIANIHDYFKPSTQLKPSTVGLT